MKRVVIIFLVLALIVAGLANIMEAPEKVEARETGYDSPDYTTTFPFRIDSDSYWPVSGFSGDGSPGNPWIIQNYEIDGSGEGYCIYIGNTTEHFVIRDCLLRDTQGVRPYPFPMSSNYGIMLYNVENARIVNNTVTGNEKGVDCLASCRNITIENNRANDNLAGISIYDMVNGTISNNTANNNDDYGIWIDSLSDGEVSNNWVNSSSMDAIHLRYSSNVNISNNEMVDNGIGISVRSTTNGIISSNTANYNDDYGISVYDSSGYLVKNNWINSSSMDAIYLAYSINITLTGNQMVDNGITIFEGFSGGHMEYWNTHNIDSTNRVNDRAVRYWKNAVGGIVSPDAGQIILANCSEVTVQNQNISRVGNGITLAYSDNNILDNVTAFNNIGHGFYIHYSDGNYFNSIVARRNGNGSGLYLTQSENNTVSMSTFIDNWFGVNLEYYNHNFSMDQCLVYRNDIGISVYESDYTTISRSDITHCDEVGIAISDSQYNTINNNDIYNNSQEGIQIAGWSTSHSIHTNRITDCQTGIRLLLTTGNNIFDNMLLSNNIGGILAEESGTNTIRNNTIYDSEIGIYLKWSSNNNLIYHNNLIYNRDQAWDDSSNSWDNGYPSGGNYWSDYTNPDDDNDGIGDVARPIAKGENQDNYPLMTSSVDLEPPTSFIDPIQTYWNNTKSLTVTATAQDKGGSTVDSASLWYIFSSNNSTWNFDNWTYCATDELISWSWDFNFPEGEGYYKLTSTSNDSAGHVETELFNPEKAEQPCAYDGTSPAINLKSPVNNSVILKGTQINIVVNETNLFHTNHSINGGPVQSGVYIQTLTWQEGDYVVIVNAMDMAGNTNQSVYLFSVAGTGPHVVATLPEDDDDEIDVNTTITIIFNEPVNTTSVEKALSFTPVLSVQHFIWAGNNTTLTIKFTSYLALNTSYTISIGTTMTDIHGNHLLTDYNFTFMTLLDTDKDGIPNRDDPDDDNDGVIDSEDLDPLDPAITGEENLGDASDNTFGNSLTWLAMIIIIVIGGILAYVYLKKSKSPAKPPEPPEVKEENGSTSDSVSEDKVGVSEK